MRQGGKRPLPGSTGAYPEPPEKEIMDQSIRRKLIGQMLTPRTDATVYSTVRPEHLQLTFLEFNRLHDKLMASGHGYVLKLTYDKDYHERYWEDVLSNNPTLDPMLIKYLPVKESEGSFGGCRYRAYVSEKSPRPIISNHKLIDVFSGTKLVKPVTS